MLSHHIENQISNQMHIQSKFMKVIRSKTQCTSPPSSERSFRVKESKAATDKKETNFSDASFSSQNIEFISSIINKIKNVERRKPLVNPNVYVAKFYQEQKPLTKGFKRIKYADDSNKKQFVSPTLVQQKNENSNCLLRKYEQQNLYLEKELQKIKKENKQLKDTISSMGLTLSFMKEQYKKIQTQFKEKKDRISQLQTYLQQKQTNFANQLEAMCNTIEELKNQNIQFQNSTKIESSSTFFKIGQTLDEVVFPSQNTPLIKAQQQIRLLKVELINLQKKSFQNISLLRRQKNEQITILRKAFQRNLNHYKEVTIKQTFRQTFVGKNRPQNGLQTTIEVCSTYES